jgi:hypothetical protein
MKNQKHPRHLEAAQNGGRSQSQIEYTCPRCGRVGRGNNWNGGHCKKGKGCKMTFDTSSVEKHIEELQQLLKTINFYD